MTAIVTDHALVRWLERVHGIKMEDLRDELAAAVQPYAELGVAGADIDGLWYVFDGPKLVTILPERPRLQSKMKNDQDYRNGTNRPREELPWKAKKRKRAHK